MESRLRPWLKKSELERIDELMERYGMADPAVVPSLVADSVHQSEQLNDRECINLYAGTNVMDPQARMLAHNVIWRKV